MHRAEVIGDRLILLRQDAAGGVQQPATRLHQRGSGLQDGALFGGKLENGFAPMAPFQVRITPQRAETAARCIDQHAIELPGQAFHARIALARKRNRMHARDAGARRAGSERGQAPLRDIHRVDAAGASHEHRQRERLAACARTVVGDHLASPRRK